MNLHDFLSEALAALDLLGEVQRLQASMSAQVDALRTADGSSPSRADFLEQVRRDYEEVSGKLVALSEIITVFFEHRETLDKA
ncbi:hypothetical protein HMF7854_04235 [Sphingomonas ginkgonis]|uniref:Uncharacterized protein n=1 Tax=Sphingomonas ginkgonis TaxID=2315330 RepID=A0A429V853_9SPHN|nr:hypothetical protein [Sphingomonas ginkgonis]RST30119.1 hypothetical protein HMF7854_04235 [Sphingomonas ginkgonis]